MTPLQMARPKLPGFGPDGFAEVEVMVVFDGTGFGEVVVTGFIDTPDALEVEMIATIDATGFAQVE